MRASRSGRVRRRYGIWSAILLTAIVLVAAVYFYRNGTGGARSVAWSDGTVQMPARADNDRLQIYRDDAWQNLRLQGVNMGIAKPGHFPGETAITKEEYARWFRQIGEMHANVVRVYTIHPPGFYEALAAYNRNAAQPLYLLQGVWANEETLLQTMDAFAPDNRDAFREEIERTVDLIHGQADILPRPGHASGSYRADVSPYVLGWVLGVEWDPNLVVATNAKHADMPQFAGTYFRTAGASPFEIWLADAMEAAATYEQDKYGWQRPMSFTNWVTTDLLRHPAEPSAKEDMVAVDPNRIETTSAYLAGLFASYHVYPYYPDFLNYDRELIAYVDARGKNNSYAGYLHALKQEHRMPVVIAEFGVPSSRGMTHRNVNGWNQGFHSEREQGEIVSLLWQDIVNEGMAGGLVFTWQDEWFKRTWNTMDLDDPDRRPFWSNAQTGEQQFGLLAFDPGEKTTVIQLDGEDEDWRQAGIPAVEAAGDDGEIARYAVASDERYVYFRLDMREQVDWARTEAIVLIDSIEGQGQLSVPGIPERSTDAGFDFAVELRGPEQSRVLVDSYYDPFEYQYGHMLRMLPMPDDAGHPNNGRWNSIRLALNKELTIPDRQGADRVIPFDYYETGKLKFGNGDPASPDYDSLADVAVKGRTIELRVPWQLLNVRDPSTRTVMGDLWQHGMSASAATDGLRIAVVAGKRDADAIPAPVDGLLRKQDMNVYRWETWDFPKYHERLKSSYAILQEEFAQSEPGE